MLYETKWRYLNYYIKNFLSLAAVCSILLNILILSCIFIAISSTAHTSIKAFQMKRVKLHGRRENFVLFPELLIIRTVAGRTSRKIFLMTCLLAQIHIDRKKKVERGGGCPFSCIRCERKRKGTAPNRSSWIPTEKRKMQEMSHSSSDGRNSLPPPNTSPKKLVGWHSK